MLLSDRGLMVAVEGGQIGITPFDPDLVQPASVDVRLDNQFQIFNTKQATHIDPFDTPERLKLLTAHIDVPVGEPFVLHPGEFVLASTLETITMGTQLAGRLEGKSSLGRLGLLVHSTAGFIDPGFTGHITLELSNVASLPILLWPGMRIGQLCVCTLSSPAQRPYGSPGLGSRYQGQVGPTASCGVSQVGWSDV